MQAKILFVFLYKKIEAGQPDGAVSLRRHAQINSIRIFKPLLIQFHLRFDIRLHGELLFNRINRTF